MKRGGVFTKGPLQLASQCPQRPLGSISDTIMKAYLRTRTCSRLISGLRLQRPMRQITPKPSANAIAVALIHHDSGPREGKANSMPSLACSYATVSREFTIYKQNACVDKTYLTPQTNRCLKKKGLPLTSVIGQCS